MEINGVSSCSLNVLNGLRRQKNGRDGRACPETGSTLEKVRDYRKLLIPLRCSEIVSK